MRVEKKKGHARPLPSTRAGAHSKQRLLSHPCQTAPPAHISLFRLCQQLYLWEPVAQQLYLMGARRLTAIFMGARRPALFMGARRPVTQAF